MNYKSDKIIYYGTYENMKGFWIEVKYATIDNVDVNKDFQDNVRALIDIILDSKIIDNRHCNTKTELINTIRNLRKEHNIHYKLVFNQDKLGCKPYTFDYSLQYKINGKDMSRIDYGLEQLKMYIQQYKRGLISRQEFKNNENAIFIQLFDINI